MFRPRLLPTTMRSIQLGKRIVIRPIKSSPILQLCSFSSRINNTTKTNAEEIWKQTFTSSSPLKGRTAYPRATTTSAFDQFYESFAGEHAGSCWQPCWERKKTASSKKGKENEEINGYSYSYSSKGEGSSRSGPFNQRAFWENRFRQEHHHHPGSFRTWRRSHLSSNRRRRQFHMRYCKQRKSLSTGLIYFSSTRTGKVQPDYKPAFTFVHTQFAPTKLSPLSVLLPQIPIHPSPLPSYPRPLSSSILSLAIRHSSTPTYSSIRLLSTSSSVRSSSQLQVLQAGIPVLPLLALLKSSTALSSITWISRLALTFLPFSLRAKLIHAVQEKYRRDGINASAWVKRMVESRVGVGATLEPSSIGHRINSGLIAPGLLLLPLVLLASIIIASYERTPISGRARIIMVSEQEEEELVKSILGSNLIDPKTGERDWVSILGNVLGLEDEGISRTTGRRILLGGEVLDESDWRWRWTNAVLKALEVGVPMLASTGSATQHLDVFKPVLEPPPSKYRLKPRGIGSSSTTGSGKLNAEYDLLIIDRLESNAFSFGFGPDELVIGGKNRKRGVIVVYSGFLNEILGITPTLSSPQAQKSTGFFSSLFVKPPVLEPTTPPTLAQSKSLATLLSHELAHLLLSHTLESYANTTLLIPQLQKMCSDVFRTLIFPFTALLGPFVNDGIGRSMNELSITSSQGYLGQVCNSCESRKLELEADVVGLRLLAYAGIDPRHALFFWENRLQAQPLTSPSSTVNEPAPSNHLRLHSSAESQSTSQAEVACGFLRTHPVNEERVKKIRDELDSWARYHKVGL